MVVLGVRLIAILAAWSCTATAARSVDQVFPASNLPPITNGLVHYWPNLWNARDELTGVDGVIMGVLPEIANGAPDDIAFSDQTGWVQLPVDLRSSEFTVCLWLRPDSQRRTSTIALELYCGQHRWWLQGYAGADGYRFHTPGRDQPGIELALPIGVWTHVAITKRGAGIIAVCKDGLLVDERDLPLPENNRLSLISAGNCVKGDIQWRGIMSELLVFDRALSPEEARQLHAAGFHRHPSQDTPARRLATGASSPGQWSTNISRSTSDSFTFQRYTTEEGLPANTIQCLHQTRDGYLWIGTDEGLARFDGRRFRSWTANNEPALAAVGSDIISLCEAADGSLWAGGYGGLLRISNGQISAFTNLLESLIIQVAPGESNTIWVAGFRTDRTDRGPCRVRRFHPDTETTTDHVLVPGHVRRIVPAESGIWMATEEPEQVLFWDRSAPAPVVIGKISGPPLEITLRAGPLARSLHARGWRDPLDSENAFVELAGGEVAPSSTGLARRVKPRQTSTGGACRRTQQVGWVRGAGWPSELESASSEFVSQTN